MAYSDHVGYGHTWKRTGIKGFCECGLRLPPQLEFTKPLPRSQEGQLAVATALDLLARFDLVAPCPAEVTRPIWNEHDGRYDVV